MKKNQLKTARVFHFAKTGSHRVVTFSFRKNDYHVFPLEQMDTKEACN